MFSKSTNLFSSLTCCGENTFSLKNNNHLLQLGKALKDATVVWRKFKTLKMGTEAAVIGRAVSH